MCVVCSVKSVVCSECARVKQQERGLVLTVAVFNNFAETIVSSLETAQNLIIQAYLIYFTPVWEWMYTA